jgi:hypothetical protein
MHCGEPWSRMEQSDIHTMMVLDQELILGLRLGR